MTGNEQIGISILSTDLTDVTDVTFRLYSTKYYLPDSDIYEDVIFNEKAQTASLKEDTAFDQTFKTIVIAHGNGGGYKIDQDFWKHYSQVVNSSKIHIRQQSKIKFL